MRGRQDNGAPRGPLGRVGEACDTPQVAGQCSSERAEQLECRGGPLPQINDSDTPYAIVYAACRGRDGGNPRESTGARLKPVSGPSR